MKRTIAIRGAGWLAAVLLAATLAPAAHAGFPDPSNSTCPTQIRIAGFSGGVADPAGEFCVVVRDLANNPVPGVRVVVDLSDCPDVRVCADVLDPDIGVVCGGMRFDKLSDLNGSACFTLPGGSIGGAGTPGFSTHPARLYAEFTPGTLTLLCSIPVAVFDLDGVDGLGAGDLSVWIGDFFSGTNPDRADYESDGLVGAADLARWIDAYLSGHSAQSCGARCP